MAIHVHHRGPQHDGRGDDPHGVTGSTYNTSGYRTEAGPLAHPGQVGTYLGSAGNSHFFTPEATRGGASDSHVVTIDPQYAGHLKQGERYSVQPDASNPGFHHALPYSGHSHGDQPGAPHSESNPRDRVVAGQRPASIGPVTQATGPVHQTGMVGHLIGHTGSHAWMSSEATGGGDTDSIQFPHQHSDGRSVVQHFAGQRVAAIPTENGGHYKLAAYDPRAHGHLPGAPKER